MVRSSRAGDASAVCINWPARCTARRMRICVPQRHRLSASSARIFGVGRFGIPLQQGLRPHHHAGDTIAALRRLLLDEGALDRRRRLDRSQAFERRDLPALQQHQRRDAGQHRLAVDDHRAGAALAEAAAEFGGVELEIVAQHIEQRRIGIRVDLMVLTIDLQCHHGLSRLVASAARCGARRNLQKGGLRTPGILRRYWRCRSMAAGR